MIEQLRKSENAEAKCETEKDATVEQKSRSWDLFVLHVTCCPRVLQEKRVLFAFGKYKPWRRRWLLLGFVLHILQLLQPEGNLGQCSSDFWVSWTRFLCKPWKKRAIIDQQSLERRKVPTWSYLWASNCCTSGQRRGCLLFRTWDLLLPLLHLVLKVIFENVCLKLSCVWTWNITFCYFRSIPCMHVFVCGWVCVFVQLDISPISQVPLNQIWQQKTKVIIRESLKRHSAQRHHLQRLRSENILK